MTVPGDVRRALLRPHHPDQGGDPARFSAVRALVAAADTSGRPVLAVDPARAAQVLSNGQQRAVIGALLERGIWMHPGPALGPLRAEDWARVAVAELDRAEGLALVEALMVRWVRPVSVAPRRAQSVGQSWWPVWVTWVAALVWWVASGSLWPATVAVLIGVESLRIVNGRLTSRGRAL